MNRVNQKYAYVSHPDHLPLELNGNSKKKILPLKREDFNETKCNINLQSKSLIMKKMSVNIHDFANNKSILPGGDSRKTVRPNSIKTFKENKQNIKGSGVEYLLLKVQNQKPNHHKERAHLKQGPVTDKKCHEKKHFVQSQDKLAVQAQSKQVKHKQTHDTRLAQDIYSNPYRLERQPAVCKKLQTNNFFKNSVDLGLEQKKTKRVSDNKMIQMMGSQHVKDMKGGLRERRQDWRVSNINFF